MPTFLKVEVKPINLKKLIEVSCDLHEEDGLNVQNYGRPLHQKVATKTALHREVQGSSCELIINTDYSNKNPNRKATLRDKDGETSLTKLFELLVAVRHIDTEGEYVVINTSDFNPEDIQSLIDTLLKGEDRLELLPYLMEVALDDENANALTQIVSEQPEKAKYLADALNLIRKSQILDEFEKMVEQKLDEPKYQKFLEKHNWIFGSEYSELLPDRRISADHELDFLLRKTADGYLEVIEIKTPGEELFRVRSKGLSERKAVVDAISQVDDYLDEMEDNKDKWYSRKHSKVEKIRGKVVIGRDGDDNQMKALRKLNARYHRIEVITFDQLIAIAQRMLDILAQEGASEPPSPVDDIPF